MVGKPLGFAGVLLQYKTACAALENRINVNANNRVKHFNIVNFFPKSKGI